jgi:two-component system, NarL family, sensor kinase
VFVVTYPWQQVWIPAILVSFNLLLVVYALAVARYRLHDLEPALGRAAIAGAVSLLVAAVYATIVVGAGAAIGRRVDSRLLPLAAVAAVALLIEPVRRAARQLVDRVLFRRSADRSEVMSRLAAHANAAAAMDVVTEVTDLLVRSTGATRAEVHLAGDPSTGPGGDDADPPVLRATIQHQGEPFGEIRLYATARADLVPDAAQLLADVAHTLGIVLRNDRLTAQLQTKFDELHASRRRLVEAHDHARRSLERDIHDGAQSRLIALRMRLAALRSRLDRTGEGRTLVVDLDEIGRDVEATIRSLRALARGLHPPLLDQSGLTAALRAHARGLPIPVAVTAHGLARYPRATEAAVYFACLEAIQNAIRHSGATTVTVDLTDGDGLLCFRISDNGSGFDPGHAAAGAGLANIDDRLTALGGTATIDSTPGLGTRVTGSIPTRA